AEDGIRDFHVTGVQTCALPIYNGRQGRDEFLKRNGCSTDTVPVAPDECVAYQGCREGYPVTWCEWNGGHSTPGFAGQAVWDFFRSEERRVGKDWGAGGAPRLEK